MRRTLTDYLGSVLDAPISRLRRQAISIAICVAGAIGAIFYAAAAATLALEAASRCGLWAADHRRRLSPLLAIGAIVIPRLIVARRKA